MKAFVTGGVLLVALMGTALADSMPPSAAFPPPPISTSASRISKSSDETEGYATGFEVAGFGGLDFAQNGGWERHTNVASAPYGAKSDIGWMEGVKLGYTWPGLFKGPGFNGDPANGVVDGKHFTLLPSLEFEFFAFNHEQEGLGRGDTFATRANLDGYVFTLNPLMRAQIGIFRPYIGGGPGGAYLTRDDPELITRGLVAPGTGSGSDLVMALQFEAGVDIFVTRNVSLFGEYKVVDFLYPSFNNNGVTYKSNQIVNDEFVTLGVRYHF